MDAAAYGRMVRRLFPRGALWNWEEGSILSRMALAVGDELERVELRGKGLMDEVDPRTTLELLPDWERVLGLPDEDVLEIPSTTATRRLAIIQKLVKRGGQSAAYYIRVAAACGYTVTVDDGYGDTVALCGRARCGDMLRSEAWAHVWRVIVQPPAGPALTTDELERVIRRVAPSHSVVFFTYV